MGKKREIIQKMPGIITGKDKDDPYQLRGLFISAFTHCLLDQMFTAFEVKSLGGVDELGHKFAPLSERRLKYKQSEAFRRKYPYALTNGIVRVTEQIMRSYEPGILVGANYFPPKDQMIELKNNLIKISSKVDYAPFQSAKRPFFPDDIGPWISKAIQAGLEAVAKKLEQLI